MTPTRSRTGPLDLAEHPAEVHDHVYAVGHGPDGFTETVAAVLDHAADDDLLVVMGHLAPSPLGRLVRRHSVAHPNLVLLDPDQGYRSVADPVATRAAFGALVDAAVTDGHPTVRIVADNTGRLAGVDAAVREQWWTWEHTADAWQLTLPVTGTCWFDADRLDPSDLRGAAHRHARGGGPDVAWRVFTRPRPDGGRPLDVVVVGTVPGPEVDEFAAVVRGAASAAAEDAAPGTTVEIDVTGAVDLDPAVLDVLRVATRGEVRPPRAG